MTHSYVIRRVMTLYIWHGACIHDMTLIGHDSLICDTTLYIWQDSFICDMSHVSCLTWLIHMWHDSLYLTWLIYRWHLSCLTWLIHMWHDSLYFTWLVHMWHESHLTSLIRMGHDSIFFDMAQSYVTLLFIPHDSYNTTGNATHVIYVTWLIHVCRDSFVRDMTRSYETWLVHMWHGPFICCMTHSFVT